MTEILPLCSDMEQIEFEFYKELKIKTEEYEGDYIYLIQTNKYFNTNVYKIGRTERLHGRMNDYKQTCDIKIFGIWKVENCVDVEREILDSFKTKFRVVQGREFIEGYLDHIYQEIEKIIESQENSESP